MPDVKVQDPTRVPRSPLPATFPGMPAPRPPSNRPRLSSQAPGARVSLVDPDWLADDAITGRNTEISLQIPVVHKEPTRASLTLITGLNAGQVFVVEEADVVIGRSRDATIRVDDVGISRHHSRVSRAPDGSYRVEDLDSTNGTFIGGRKITSAPLESGDQIHVGPNVVFKFALVDEAEEALAKQLYESSTRDPLTGAFNRKYFVERLQSEVAYAMRHRTSLGILVLDLDHFKSVNDTHGHLAGDEVLRAVSHQIAKLIRAEDVFARYGGEEFVILVRGIEHRNVARFAERVRKAVEGLAVAWQDALVRPTLSVGVASLQEVDPTESTGEGMLHLADERLYEAKSAGRNRVCSEGPA